MITTSHAQTGNPHPFKKTQPIPPKLQPLPLNEIKPLGWLKQEINKNLQGFTGQLDLLAPDLIKEDLIYGQHRLSPQTKSKNLGAVGESGEWQVQYLWWNSETQSNWLDGLIRSAVLLNDSIHLIKAGQFVQQFLNS